MAHVMLRYLVVREGVCGKDYTQTIRLGKEDQIQPIWAQNIQIFD